jgi:hypothetical protein
MVSPAPHEDQEHCCKNQKQPAGCLKKQPAGCLKAVQSLHVHGTEEGHHSSERSHGKPSTKTRSIVAKIRCALAALVTCMGIVLVVSQRVVRRITGLSLLPASSSDKYIPDNCFSASSVCAPADRVRERFQVPKAADGGCGVSGVGGVAGAKCWWCCRSAAVDRLLLLGSCSLLPGIEFNGINVAFEARRHAQEQAKSDEAKGCGALRHACEPGLGSVC